MRILYLTLLDFPRRVANRGQIVNMCEGFSCHSKCSLVIAHSYLSEQELRAYYGVSNRFKIHVLGKVVRRSRVLTLIRLLVVLVTWRPDLIYVREEKLALLLSFLPWRYIYEVHEVFKAGQKAQIRAINRSVMTVAILEALRTECIEMGANGSRIIVENLAINADHYQTDQAHKPPKFLLPEKGKVKLLYSGRFSVQKGVYTLVEAMTYLPEQYHLVMLGGFEGEATIIEAHAHKFGVADRVKLVGYVPHAQVQHYLRAADILILPNSNDPSVIRHTNPLKLYEYLAAGSPIVASRIDAISSIVSDNIVAFFEADNPKDLARTVLETTQNPDQARNRVAQARAYISTRDWVARTKRIIGAVKNRNSAS